MSDRPDIDAYLKDATAEARKDALIAELVEALEDVLDGLGFLSGGDHELEGLGISETRARKIRAALSKAKRETGQ